MTHRDGRADRPSDHTDRYRTIAEPGRAAFEIRGSRFIGHAAPVRSVERAETIIAGLESDHDDATHAVPAYRVRADPLHEWSNDDGEPTGSAGKPILNVLQQQDLENVVIVVTRYFGGTKLGVGGLARAYARGAKEAIEDAGVVEREPHERIDIVVDYDDSGTVRGILESEGLEIDAAYEADVRFAVWAPVTDAERVRDRIRSATSGRADIE